MPNHSKKQHTADNNAITLAARTHSSFLRLTIRPLSRAHFWTALAMSALALFSFSPDLTVFFASNSSPGLFTFSAIPTLRLTGIYRFPFATFRPGRGLSSARHLPVVSSIILRSAR